MNSILLWPASNMAKLTEIPPLAEYNEETKFVFMMQCQDNLDSHLSTLNKFIREQNPTSYNKIHYDLTICRLRNTDVYLSHTRYVFVLSKCVVYLFILFYPYCTVQEVLLHVL